MTKQPPFISLRADIEMRVMINALRRKCDPIPSMSDVIRQAVEEKYAREIQPEEKANGRAVAQAKRSARAAAGS